MAGLPMKFCVGLIDKKRALLKLLYFFAFCTFLNCVHAAKIRRFTAINLGEVYFTQDIF